MVRRAVLQDEGPEEGSEVKYGRMKGRKRGFWLGKQPKEEGQGAAGMAKREGAGTRRGGSRWRSPGICKGWKVGSWGISLEPPAGGPAPSQHREGLGSWVQTPGGLPCLCPQAGAVSTRGSRSHLLLPCGNQSLLRKVSTNAPLAPGVIDAGSRNISVGPLPPWRQGPDACHTNVPALVL